MDCKYENICKNSGKCCFKCYDESMLLLPTDKSAKVIKNNSVKANADDSWKDLEEQTALKLNNIPKIKDARRSRASGALWFEKGDIVDDIIHPECKERIGNEIAHGADKSFSIKKSWLTKAKAEAEDVNKPMCLPFRFKTDEDIYVVMDFDDLAELIVNYKALLLDYRMLEEENKLLNNK